MITMPETKEPDGDPGELLRADLGHRYLDELRLLVGGETLLEDDDLAVVDAVEDHPDLLHAGQPVHPFAADQVDLNAVRLFHSRHRIT